MKQSKALHRLIEAADLINMLEDLTNPSSMERLSAASHSGLRITLKNIRESILGSHDVLAKQLLERARSSAEQRDTGSATQELMKAKQNQESNSLGDPQAINIQRRDLRTSMEKFVEK